MSEYNKNYNKNELTYYLASKIYKLLSQGMNLTPDILHYIQSTFGLNSSRDIYRIILDDNHCERESLLELIFFPNQEMKIALERPLEAGQFKLSDHQNILKNLMNLDPKVPIYFESGEHLLTMSLPENTASKFINRLCIQNHPDRSLIEVIENLFPEKEQLTIRSKLRHKSCFRDEDTLDFLKQFIKSYSSSKDIFWEYLDFVLNFLTEFNKGPNIFEVLIRKRLFLEQVLLQSKHQEELLHKQTMETLILQGQRILSINPDAVQRSVEIIDDLAFKIFGHIPFPEDQSSPLELDLENNWTNLDRIFDLFNDTSPY